jgi:hypothetical protein
MSNRITKKMLYKQVEALNELVGPRRWELYSANGGHRLSEIGTDHDPLFTGHTSPGKLYDAICAFRHGIEVAYETRMQQSKALQHLNQMDTDLGIFEGTFDETLAGMSAIEAASKLHQYLLWAKLAGKSGDWLEDTEELIRWANHAGVNLQTIIDCWE